MLFLDEKRQQATENLNLAVDIVQNCIWSASRHVRDDQLAGRIEQELNAKKLLTGIWVDVMKEAVHLFDGDKEVHSHVSLSQADGSLVYWRNVGEPHGPQNFFR